MAGKTLLRVRFMIRNCAMLEMHLPKVLLFTTLLLFAGCEIRPLDPETGKAIIAEAQQSFDASSFVEANWEEGIIPGIHNEAVDLTTLLMELDQDQEAASAKYGYREGSRAYNFKVKGIGRVVDVDTTSRAATLRINLADHSAEVILQIGPVIRGTSLRDALPFITFDQFVNQLEYAKVSNEIHARLVKSLLLPVNHHALLNQKIRFIGAFTLRNIDSIMITPVEIQVERSE